MTRYPLNSFLNVFFCFVCADAVRDFIYISLSLNDLLPKSCKRQPFGAEPLILTDKSAISFLPKLKVSVYIKIVKALLDGKLVIVMDTSPFAIILPAVLADFINPISDKYLYQRNANNLKILRASYIRGS